MSKKNPKTPIHKGSGNVFADLGLPNAKESHTKARLAAAINHIIAERRLSQSRAARRLGINQPKISALAHYRLDGFSVDRLMHLLGRLGRDIEIVIRPKSRSRKSSRILVSSF